MGRLPADTLNEVRSPARALADLIETFETLASDHPALPRLAQMIRQLADEIVRRHSVPAAEFGLC